MARYRRTRQNCAVIVKNDANRDINDCVVRDDVSQLLSPVQNALVLCVCTIVLQRIGYMLLLCGTKYRLPDSIHCLFRYVLAVQCPVSTLPFFCDSFAVLPL